MKKYLQVSKAICIVMLFSSGCISIEREQAVKPVRQEPKIIIPVPAPVVVGLEQIPAGSPMIKTGNKAGSFALVRIPPYTTELKGSNEVRLRNPNNVPVLVMIRCGEEGKNLEIPAKSMTLVYLPDGGFQISYVFADVPNAVMRSDYIRLPTLNRPDIGIPLSGNR